MRFSNIFTASVSVGPTLIMKRSIVCNLSGGAPILASGDFLISSACLFRIGFNLHRFWQLNIFIPLSLFVLNLFLLAPMLIVVDLLINSVILPLNTRFYGHKAISDFPFKKSINSIAGAGPSTFLFLKRGCQPGNGWFLIIQNDNASFEISSCQALCRALEYAGRSILIFVFYLYGAEYQFQMKMTH